MVQMVNAMRLCHIWQMWDCEVRRFHICLEWSLATRLWDAVANYICLQDMPPPGRGDSSGGCCAANKPTWTWSTWTWSLSLRVPIYQSIIELSMYKYSWPNSWNPQTSLYQNGLKKSASGSCAHAEVAGNDGITNFKNTALNNSPIFFSCETGHTATGHIVHARDKGVLGKRTGWHQWFNYWEGSMGVEFRNTHWGSLKLETVDFLKIILDFVVFRWSHEGLSQNIREPENKNTWKQTILRICPAFWLTGWKTKPVMPRSTQKGSKPPEPKCHWIHQLQNVNGNMVKYCCKVIVATSVVFFSMKHFLEV